MAWELVVVKPAMPDDPSVNKKCVGVVPPEDELLELEPPEELELPPELELLDEL